MASRAGAWSVLGLLIVGLLIGCNTGSRGSSNMGGGPGPTPTPTPTPPPGGATLNFTAVALQAGQAQQDFSGPVVALAFTLQATNADVFFRGLTITNTGTVDESTLGATVSLVEDTNSDGLVSMGEPTVGTAPAVAMDDDNHVIAVNPAIQLMPTATRQFLVVIDGPSVPTAGQVGAVGRTLNMAIATVMGNNPFNADDGGTPPQGVTFNGTLPHMATVTLFLNDHLVISEVINSPTAQEAIEIFNPTTAAVTLTNYHLTDFTDNSVFPTQAYFQLPTGNNFGPAASSTQSHFHARFPAGSMIMAGQVITVAVDGTAFMGATGVTPEFCLRNAGAGMMQMLTWDGVMGFNFQPNPVQTSVGLANAGETVILYHFDGGSGQVLTDDVDVVNYNDNPSQLNFPIDKSGQMVMGQTFPMEQSIVFQSDPMNRTPVGVALQRTDYSEGTEPTMGGAGITGDDETAEPFMMTWQAGTATPGAVP